MAGTYLEAPNRMVTAANGSTMRIASSVTARFRWCSSSISAATWTTGIPGSIDALASTRRVVTFDNRGVGGSTGTTPTP